MRKQIRQFLVQWGYRVDCIRNVPRHLLDPAKTASLVFDHAVCRSMVEKRRPLSFLQVGAFDGVTKDPLYTYIRDHGWYGTLVEPQPHACDLLRKLHTGNPNVRVVNAAIAASKGTSTLYMVKGDNLPAWCGGLASFSRDSIVKHSNLIPELEKFIITDQVQTLSFSEILRSTEAANDLDVLQIDTEGSDAEMLRLFPFSTICPSIVHWEVKHLSKVEKESCLDLLSPLGYRFAPSGEEDMLAVLA